MGNICSLFFGCARYEDVDQNHAQQQEEERIIGTGSFPKNGPRMERITEMEKLYKQKEQLEGELKKKVQEAEESRHKEEELKSLQLRHHDIESHLKKSHKYEKSARLQKEAELEALRKRSAEVESSYQEELQKERSARQQKEAELKALRKSIADMETLHKEQLHEERSARQQKEELEALRKRSAEVESSYQEELQKERESRPKEEELKSLQLRHHDIESHLKKSHKYEKAARQQKEELEAFRKSIADMETLHKEQLHEERSARQQKEAELRSFKNRMAAGLAAPANKEEAKSSTGQSEAETERLYREKLERERAARQQKEAELEALRKRLDAGLKAGCRSCEQQEREHRESMTEMDTFYKNKLQEARSAAKQKEEELKSFRERLAADVSVSLKAGDTESINDPVSKTRLVEMYDNLKLLHWPKMKEALKAATMQPQEARALIQASFEAAAQAMKKKRQLVEEAFGAAGPSGGAGPQKVREYRQITLGNLKMAVFHSSKADLLQTHLPEHGGGLPQSELLDVGALRSECFWLGCLMALNSPPLQPDWENHTPGMDPWDLFPRDIKPYSAV
ncbi:uncharacterized protein ACNS7B_024005 isoform 6-T6 [Menidia menidia]